MPTPINSLPISLAPIPAPVGISAADFNQLLTNICQYISATVQTNVTFIQEFSTPPAAFSGNIIFVTGINNWMVWDTGAGQYIPLNQLTIGAVVQQSVIYGAASYDDIPNGWIYLNGRLITSIAGLSATQIANLQTIYPNTLPPYGGFLPNIQPLAVFPEGQMAIAGGISSGPGFLNTEVVTQAVTGATGIVYLDQGPGIGNLVITGLTGTPNGSDIWTGGTSGTTFTPSGVPVPFFGPYPVVSRVFIGANIAP